MNPQELLRYQTQAPRYTSYPPANFFQEMQDPNSYIPIVQASNQDNPQNLSFYFHLPFCPILCHFCGCNTEIGRGGKFIQRYMEALHTEMDWILPHVNEDRPVTQIHFGGGTPNAVPFRYLEQILSKLKEQFTFAPDAEIAIECDPSLLKPKRLEELRAIGFTRISFGIQDTKQDVLDAVNRKPSLMPVKELISKARELGFKGLNLDLIYGLPLQTPESFEKTVAEIIEARPDRIACFGYAHIPWLKERQKEMDKYPRPGTEERIQINVRTVEQFKEAGYQFIGLDHFALPEDELSIAQNNHRLHRNFQGYCSKEQTGQVYSFGASSISQLHAGYYQNIKDSTQYISCIESGILPLEKHQPLSSEQHFFKRILEEVLCNKRLDLSEIAKDFSLTVEQVKENLGEPWNRLAKLQEEGLVLLEDHTLEVTAKGEWVLRWIAKELDPLMHGKDLKMSYSQAI